MCVCLLFCCVLFISFLFIIIFIFSFICFDFSSLFFPFFLFISFYIFFFFFQAEDGIRDTSVTGVQTCALPISLNTYVLWVNRASIPHVWRRVVPMILGLAPGVALGTALVHRVQPAGLKLGTFIILLPLILRQAAGFRSPIKDERRLVLVFGGGLGVLYSVTTISGPPLAVMLSNQGFTKQDFRASLGLVRLAESSFTAVAYYFAGMFSIESAGLLPYVLPSLVVGIPLGVRVIRHVRPDTFRRVCMSFDAWVVGYGISTLLRQLHLIETNAAFSVLAAVGLIDIWLLYRFFRHQTLESVAAGAQPAPATQ